MIVVRVELWSAVTGQKTEIARMHIANDGSEERNTRGNYTGYTFRGRNSGDLDQAVKDRVINRAGRVNSYPRLSLHVWHLVARMLKSMNYA